MIRDAGPHSTHTGNAGHGVGAGPPLPALFVLVVLCIAGCAGLPVITLAPIEIDTKGRSSGLPVPEWYTVYQAGGLVALEALPPLRGYSLWVSYTDSANLQTAELLARKPDRTYDYSRYVADRARNAFDAVARRLGNPKTFRRLSDRYVRELVEFRFSGFRRADEWWTLGRYPGLPGAPGRELYRSYVLWFLDDVLLRKQFSLLADDISPIVRKEPDADEAKRLLWMALEAEFFGP